MKQLTCAIVIFNEFDEILLAHSTGNNHYSLPKGLMDDGETPIQAAIRECKEETGLKFLENQLTVIGTYSYTSSKDIFFTTVSVNKSDINMDELICESMFERYGKFYPEMDGYLWADRNDCLKYMNKSLVNIMKEVFQCN